jgi:hypothetical protein
MGHKDLLATEKGVSRAFIESRVFPSAGDQAEVNPRR